MTQCDCEKALVYLIGCKDAETNNDVGPSSILYGHDEEYDAKVGSDGQKSGGKRSEKRWIHEAIWKS